MKGTLRRWRRSVPGRDGPARLSCLMESPKSFEGISKRPRPGRIRLEER